MDQYQSQKKFFAKTAIIHVANYVFPRYSISRSWWHYNGHRKMTSEMLRCFFKPSFQLIDVHDGYELDARIHAHK